MVHAIYRTLYIQYLRILYILLIYRVSKKSVVASGEKLYFLQLSLMVFFQFFWNILFFWYSNGQKIRKTYFLFKIWSSEKQKCVYIYYLYQILKFSIYSIRESQKICKIVIRKFAIFSFGLIFKENLFFNGSSVFNWKAYITLEYT